VLARTVTHALVGLDARKVEVEAHLQNGIPGLAIVGLADRACQEAKHRVRSGIASAELEWPSRRITVNLAPAGLRKEGSGFDLPIALAILAASRQFPLDRLSGHAAIGELALDGRIRPVRGVLAAAEGARHAGLHRLLCAAESASEAALAGVEPVPARHLAEVVSYLRGEIEPPPVESSTNGGPPEPTELDLADVRVRSARGAHSSSPPRAGTTCCSPARPEPGSRCSPVAFPESCRR
jgi:magnesium chelatase family protein